MTPSTWSGDDSETAAREWAAGTTASAIADLLNLRYDPPRYTKNAVVGHMHRHYPELTGRKKRRSSPPPPKRAKPYKPKLAKPKAPPAVKPPPPVLVAVRVKRRRERHRPAGIMELVADDCRYPVAGYGEKTKFCGREVAKNHNETVMPYCREHCFIAYRNFEPCSGSAP